MNNCSNCGAPLMMGASNCPNCGHVVGGAPVPPAAPAMNQPTVNPGMQPMMNQPVQPAVQPPVNPAMNQPAVNPGVPPMMNQPAVNPGMQPMMNQPAVNPGMPQPMMQQMPPKKDNKMLIVIVVAVVAIIAVVVAAFLIFGKDEKEKPTNSNSNTSVNTNTNSNSNSGGNQGNVPVAQGKEVKLGQYTFTIDEDLVYRSEDSMLLISNAEDTWAFTVEYITGDYNQIKSNRLSLRSTLSESVEITKDEVKTVNGVEMVIFYYKNETAGTNNCIIYTKGLSGTVLGFSTAVVGTSYDELFDNLTKIVKTAKFDANANAIKFEDSDVNLGVSALKGE